MSGCVAHFMAFRLVIKESMDVEGLPSTFGLAALSSKAGGTDLIAPQDATVVQRLRDAGAIILGKTNIPGMEHRRNENVQLVHR